MPGLAWLAETRSRDNGPTMTCLIDQEAHAYSSQLTRHQLRRHRLRPCRPRPHPRPPPLLAHQCPRARPPTPPCQSRGIRPSRPLSILPHAKDPGHFMFYLSACH